MSENNNDKITAKKTLTLKRSGLETSTVKQNFSHGRTKAVVVETKRRKITRSDEKAEVPQPITKPHVAQRTKPKFEEAPPSKPVAQSNLSSAEIEARRRALEEAHIQEKITRKKAEKEKRDKEREESLYLQTHQETQILQENKSALEQIPTHTSALSPTEPIEVIDVKALEIAIPLKNIPPAEKRITNDNDNENRHNRRANSSKSEIRSPKVVKGADERRRGKLTLNSALDEEGSARGRSIAAMRRRQEKFKRAQNQEPREKISREVILPETITIQELAQRMTERSVDVIKFLMKQGQMMKPGDIIDADVAELIAVEFGHTVKRVSESDVEDGIFNINDDLLKMRPRPPVVTIMGHVDHGKTSLLDAIRKANVVSGEAGGITQHIGAYQVEQNGQKITFIDTPGHAAFTAMRARGAQVTDIAVLVVSADDSVMPQTIESINHAKAAGVPIIVAINKIDKPTADAQKVRTELLQHEVFVETMGGETLEVEVSAKTGQNLDKLLEAILLQAELLDLKADSERTAEGVIIEAKLDRGRGSVATVLVQKGTLHLSDIIVAGNEWGRVRALIDDHSRHIKEAGPSTPIEILGMQGTPQAGDRFAVVTNEAKAREIAEYRQRLARDKAVARQTGSRGSLEQMMTKLQTTGVKEFPLIIKGDVQGSIEAIVSALETLGNEEVRAHIVHSGVGGITESDISLAETSHSAIIGFNVRANKQARDAAKIQGIEIRYYNIIYDLVDDIKAAMSGLLSPEQRETFLGNAEILEVFNITKTGKVAGCRVTEGKIERGAGVRLIRDNIVIHEGKLKTLKRFKDEINEVHVGQECGMAFENYDDIRTGDIIETFRVEHISRTL
ncbi:translation initiation factor IF-2 [Bartonella clarridgeiae 73]|uniref:Translation initiation factor IF-2 n=1 Tax=Bartonella clarridgeiae (strain CCUG 45776 / CIP 104772 / 73) TaxID=696125 RepID=E6YG52_BARC7|nr:translation initiation factor IF-2 [Bartonella clarridgeiae]WCR55552.1 MAG: Translation initiation factor 2 [Bartonella clarridgeiae]CBI75840.1 translation initiation factor IF-2 [Bartonella clarridgeiae 73]